MYKNKFLQSFIIYNNYQQLSHILKSTQMSVVHIILSIFVIEKLHI